MSRDVNRDQVFQTTRVRTALKNDGSWIHKSEWEKEKQDKAWTESAVEPTSVQAKNRSSVLSAVKKFNRSVESPLNPPLQKIQFYSSEGGSEQANGEAPTKELVKNVEAQLEKIVDNTTTESKEKYAVTPLGQSNVDKTKVSEACLEDPSAATFTMAGVGKSRGPAEVPSLLADQLPEEEPSRVAEPGNATCLDGAGVQSTVQPTKENFKTNLSKQVAAETVEGVAMVVVESSPRTPAVISKPGGKSALEHSVEPFPNNVSKSPTKSADETAAKSEESKGKSTAPAVPGLKTRAEEVVQCEIQTVKNTIVKQSIGPVPEDAADCVMELSNKDTFEAVTPSKAGPFQDKSSGQTTELTDVLNVVPPTAETVPKHVNYPKQSHSERPKLTQSDDTNITEKFQKPREELPSTNTLKDPRNGEALCSFCNQIINGNVKFTISEPPVTCHMDCLKCGVCAKALGDLLTLMFLHDQVIHCDGCFVKILKT